MEQDLEEDLSKEFFGLLACYLRWNLYILLVFLPLRDYCVQGALLNAFPDFNSKTSQNPYEGSTNPLPSLQMRGVGQTDRAMCFTQ